MMATSVRTIAVTAAPAVSMATTLRRATMAKSAPIQIRVLEALVLAVPLRAVMMAMPVQPIPASRGRDV